MDNVSDVAEGIWFARDIGIVQVVLAPTLEAIVPKAEPNLYDRVCVKIDAARLVVMVMVFPIVTEPLTDGVLARGIVYSFNVDDVLGTL